jgi:hypothetical protein
MSHICKNVAAARSNLWMHSLLALSLPILFNSPQRPSRAQGISSGPDSCYQPSREVDTLLYLKYTTSDIPFPLKSFVYQYTEYTTGLESK